MQWIIFTRVIIVSKTSYATIFIENIENCNTYMYVTGQVRRVVTEVVISRTMSALRSKIHTAAWKSPLVNMLSAISAKLTFRTTLPVRWWVMSILFVLYSLSNYFSGFYQVAVYNADIAWAKPTLYALQLNKWRRRLKNILFIIFMLF